VSDQRNCLGLLHQYEEPTVKVVNSGDMDSNNTLLLTWNKDFVEDQ
jgi:hypothetical protein